MPLFTAPLVGFALGALFAFAARRAVSREVEHELPPRALAAVAAFALLVFGPAVGYFTAFATDWSLGYLLDGRRIPSALLLFAVIAEVASVPLGFSLASRAARGKDARVLLAFSFGPAALALVVLAAAGSRFLVSGTYAQVTRGAGGLPLSGSPLGNAVLFANLCIVAGAVWTFVRVRDA